MDTYIFNRIFKNIVLRKIIFSFIKSIHKTIYNQEKRYKWDIVSSRPSLLIGNDYVTRARQLIEQNGLDSYKDDISEAYLITIRKDDLETLNYLYNENKVNEAEAYLGVDLMYYASLYGKIRIIEYLDSKSNKKCKDYYDRNDSGGRVFQSMPWDYFNALSVAPNSLDLRVVEYFSKKVELIILSRHELSFTEHPFQRAINLSASINRIDMVECILSVPVVRRWRIDIANVINCAILRSHLDLLKWLQSHRLEYPVIKFDVGQYQLDTAVVVGNIDVVRWLVENTQAVISKRGMNLTAKLGRIDMIICLQQKFHLQFTQNIMDIAAGNGHLHVVKWLFSNRSEGCSILAFENSIKNNHLDVLKFLISNITNVNYTLESLLEIAIKQQQKELTHSFNEIIEYLNQQLNS